MGWWEEPKKNNAILGDGPADTLWSALSRYAESNGKPRLISVLEALEHLLKTRRMAYIADPYAMKSSIIAVIEPGNRACAPAPAAVPEPKLVRALADALESIAVEYEESELERKPTLNEILLTLAFIMGGHSEDYIADMEDAKLVSIATV